MQNPLTCLEHRAVSIVLQKSCCVGNPKLKRAGLEVPQLVRYGGSSVALQETGKEWPPAKHIFAGGDVQDRSRERLIQLGGGTIHGPGGRQL